METMQTGECVVRIDRTQVAFFMLCSLAMTAGAIWLHFLPAEFAHKPLWYLRAVGVIGAAFFGLCTLVIGARLFQRQPALVIDDEGIVDRTTYVSGGRINWSQMRGARLVWRQKFIVIDVHDPRHFIDRGNFLLRWLKAANARLVGSPVALGMSGLDTRADQVLGAIQRYFDRAMARRVSPPT